MKSVKVFFYNSILYKQVLSSINLLLRRVAASPCLCVSAMLLLVFTIASPAEERTENISSPNLHQWGAVTLFHGLPSNHVRAIAQDADGAIWLGTDNGLARYDGRNIQKIATEGLAAARIRALKFDSSGALWVGTDAGAARSVKGEIKPIAETAGNAITAIITPASNRAIMTSQQGMIFDCSVVTDGSITVRTIKPEDHSLLTIESRNNAPVQLTSLALVEDTLIVGTRSRGLLSIEPRESGSTETTSRVAIKEILSRPRAFFVEAIETDSRGRLWFGAQTTSEDSGLYESGDLMRPAKAGAGMGTVIALKFDARGNTWVGTDGQGVFVYRDSQRLEHFTFENTAGGLRSNHIYSVFIDREGVAWFGTDRGVCRYDPHSLRVEAISSDPESNFARTLFQSSDGRLWCGTNRGLFVRDKQSGWHLVEELKGKTVHSIAEDSEGRLLVGTAAGLFEGARAYSKHRLKNSSNDSSTGGLEFSRIESAPGGDNIRAIRSFKGAVYIANFGQGIERLDRAQRTLVWPIETSDERERQVVSLHAEGDSRLWIGTAEAGVFTFDGKQVATDRALDKLIGAAVWAIDGATDQAVWLASARGLYALRSGELLHIIKDSDTRSVVAAGGTLQQMIWCATVGGGLFKVLLDDEAGPIIARIDAEQGLPSQSAFAVLTARSPSGDEEVRIGTNRGVASYESGRIAPALATTRVMGNRVYSIEEVRAGLSLEYPQNSLAFDVAATSSRTFPEQFQYAFSIFDGSGRMVSRKLSRDSQLLIANLEPGRYRVVVRAFTNDLVASAPLAFEFAVAGAPFPWTTMALSVLLAFALIAMWWGYRQNRRLAGTNKALASTNWQLADTRMQLANETETERRRIARDLHDQTLADLRQLLLLTDQLPSASNGHKTIEPAAFRAEIETISTEIRRICEDLSPSVLANVGFAAALEWALSDAVAHLPAEQKFEYEFVCDEAVEEKSLLSPAMQIQVYRIVQEAISNICRHAAATRVRLAVKVEHSGDFVIQLEDNGRGFDPKSSRARDPHAGSPRGLTNIRSRASLIEAEASWSNRPEGGTIFTLRKAAVVNQYRER